MNTTIPAAVPEFWSIGHVSVQLQVSIKTVKRLMEELGVMPTAKQNGVVFIDGDSLERLRDRLAIAREAAREAARAATK